MSSTSSERKRINLRALVLELVLRDIGCPGVSELLGCSASASRYYLAELREAGLVSLQAIRHDIDSSGRNVYTLSADPPAVRHFLDRLAEPVCATHDSGSKEKAPGRRDPLVAALFGAAK
jgi:hypothetical protein